MGVLTALCMVAEGSADLYPRLGPTSEWDIAAGQAVVEAAGGQVVRISDGNALRYNFALPGGEGYVSTDWSYRSKINFFLYEAVEFTGKALTEVGLRAGYVFGGGKYEAAAFVRNLTNQIRVVGGIDFNNLTGFINEPRTFGASIKASF